MRFIMLLAQIGWLASCTPSAQDLPARGVVSVPLPIAEGENPDAKPIRRAPPPAQASGPKENARLEHGSLPDPKPLNMSEQYEYVLAYDKGDVSVAAVALKRFKQPVVTARKMGRFAIELWIGKELIDRVRFDFPLVAAEGADLEGLASKGKQPSLAEGARSSVRVLVPASPRAVSALLVDRSTGHETPLIWPPDRPSGPAAATE